MLKDENIGNPFGENATELFDFVVPHLRECFRDGILWACDEVCGERMGRRCRWWWWLEVNEAIAKINDARKVMCRNSIEENENRYESMKNKTKKAVSKAVREMAE